MKTKYLALIGILLAAVLIKAVSIWGADISANLVARRRPLPSGGWDAITLLQNGPNWPAAASAR